MADPQQPARSDELAPAGRGDMADPTKSTSPAIAHTTLHPHTSMSSSTHPSDYNPGISSSSNSPTTIFLRCPKCPHKVIGTKQVFSHDTLDVKTWCNHCRRSWAVCRWQCSCELPWHACPLHQGEPARLRAAAPAPSPATTTTNSSTRPKVKRALGQGRDGAIQAWLDQPPPKRGRAPPAEVELGIAIPSSGVKHHLMGPKLRAKFPRLHTQPLSQATGQPQQLQQAGFS